MTTERPVCDTCGATKRGFACLACGGTGARPGGAEPRCPYCDGTGVAWLCPAYVAPDGRPYGGHVHGEAVGERDIRNVAR